MRLQLLVLVLVLVVDVGVVICVGGDIGAGWLGLMSVLVVLSVWEPFALVLFPQVLKPS